MVAQGDRWWLGVGVSFSFRESREAFDSKEGSLGGVAWDSKGFSGAWEVSLDSEPKC